MNKIKINLKKINKSISLKKRISALLFAGVLVITSMVPASAEKKEKTQNEIGYENFNSFINLKVKEENFIILDVGNNKYTGVNFQDKKISYCNENDISVGIIISSKATTENEIYDDVDFAKGIISNYDIDFPVYLNINDIITNDNLNVELKTKIIKNFLEKCSANNMYVGMYGTDTNLCRVKKHCQITDYDVFLVMDEEKIKYDGTYTVYKDLDRKIHSKKDLSTIINKKELNDKSNFSYDGTYEFKEGDNIIDIALKYGMSVTELLDFNEIKKDEVMVGTILRIPSVINNIIPNVNLEYELLDSPIIGCDLSYAQGKNTDWEELSKNFEFAILRCAIGTDIDACFEYNAKNCNLNDIPIGAYCYNGYTNRSCSDDIIFKQAQIKQAEFVLKTLKNKKIEYPVYLDIESPYENTGIDTLFSKEQINIMIDTWYKQMTDSGYIPGIYCNQSTLKYIQRCIDYDLSTKFQIWIAGGEQYKVETDLKDVKVPYVFNEGYNATIAQATDSAINCGAGNSKGHLDVNFSYVDYTKEKSLDNNKDDDLVENTIKDFDRTNQSLINTMIYGCSGGILLLSVASFINIKEKKKQKFLKK